MLSSEERAAIEQQMATLTARMDALDHVRSSQRHPSMGGTL